MCEICHSSPHLSRCPYAPEPKPTLIDTCCNCCEDIFEGDTYYEIDGGYWCDDCIRQCRVGGGWLQ